MRICTASRLWRLRRSCPLPSRTESVQTSQRRVVQQHLRAEDLSHKPTGKPQRPHLLQPRSRGACPEHFGGNGLRRELKMLQRNRVGVRRSHRSLVSHRRGRTVTTNSSRRRRLTHPAADWAAAAPYTAPANPRQHGFTAHVPLRGPVRTTERSASAQSGAATSAEYSLSTRRLPLSPSSRRNAGSAINFLSAARHS